MSFSLAYVVHELRRRWVRTLVTALGLAAGVSLVVGIVGVSQGLDDAQTRVLSPLRSVGTDMLVTRVVGAQASPAPSQAAGPTATPAPGARGGGGFFGTGVQAPAGINESDTLALLNDNANLVTDLARLGKPGDHFTRDFFLPATLLTFPDAAVGAVGGLPGVASAVGGLSLLATHQTGTVPTIVAQFQTGGETVQQTVTPTPLTAEESAAFQACIAAQGGFPRRTPSPTAQPQPTATPGEGDQRFAAVIQSCLPQRFRSFVATFTTARQTLEQVVDPPQTDITSTSYTAAGIDAAHPDEGLVTRTQVVQGRYIASPSAEEVLLSVAYANRQSIKVGDHLPVNGTDFTVVGLVSPTLTGNTADVYMPLAALQRLSDKPSRVNMVLVRVTDAASVDQVAAAVQRVLPGAQVVTTRTLADQVTGSLVDAKSLADRLGGALAVIVLAGAFLIAILLTLAGVGKRVREIGTLRALGWPRHMVVRQVLLETLVIGVVGGLVGVGLGVGVDAAVSHLSPSLSAGNVATLGQGSSSFAAIFGQAGRDAATAAAASREVRIDPPVHVSVLLVGVVLALLGGLVAGAVGGWRAARLAPAAALRDLG